MFAIVFLYLFEHYVCSIKTSDSTEIKKEQKDLGHLINEIQVLDKKTTVQVRKKYKYDNEIKLKTWEEHRILAKLNGIKNNKKKEALEDQLSVISSKKEVLVEKQRRSKLEIELYKEIIESKQRHCKAIIHKKIKNV